MPSISPRSLYRLTNHPRTWAYPAHFIAGRRVGGYRFITVQSTPSTDTAKIEINGKSISASSPDASFEILGSPYSLLSATISPSQHLFTRRGTLVGLSSSSPDDAISTLRILSPIVRFPLGIPFLYQRITSPTPYSALISTPSTHTTFCILELNGTTDWTLLQRAALLAWTGRTLTITPKLNTSLTPTHWGNTSITGRGLLCLSAPGQIYSITLSAGETYVAHPSNILAYTSSSPSPTPTPFRFKSSTLRLQIPLQLGNWFPSTRFMMAVRESNTYKFLHNALLRIRTWSRRTIWGDRLFLRFSGPTTILMQSRGSRVRDVLTNRQVDEIADAPAGVALDGVRDLATGAKKGGMGASDAVRMGVEGATPSAAPEGSATIQQPKMSVANISRDGKVTFETVKEPEKK